MITFGIEKRKRGKAVSVEVYADGRARGQEMHMATLTERIEALRTEAAQAGDLEMVAVCDAAIAPDIDDRGKSRRGAKAEAITSAIRAMREASAARGDYAVGDRVWAGTTEEDYDEGEIIEIRGEHAQVEWDSGVGTVRNSLSLLVHAE